MIPITLQKIAEIVNGTLIGEKKGLQKQATGLQSDSRKVKEGDIFAPIVGERVDGHDFIQKAFEAGAICCFAEKDVDIKQEQYIIRVNSVVRALLDVAEYIIKELSIPVVAVTGSVGKTTTIGKLAYNFKEQGKSVLLGAADTFRAAAIEQLEVWGQRADIDVIKHQQNSDPAAVVFDAVNAAKNRKADLLICDTAGRLHNKKNLMEELKKIAKVIDREYPEAHKEVYIVLDATTGQNAMQQAKVFQEAADITGIILTKLDGDARGGAALSVRSVTNKPIKYIGMGEKMEDLEKLK